MKNKKEKKELNLLNDKDSKELKDLLNDKEIYKNFLDKLGKIRDKELNKILNDKNKRKLVEQYHQIILNYEKKRKENKGKEEKEEKEITQKEYNKLGKQLKILDEVGEQKIYRINNLYEEVDNMYIETINEIRFLKNEC